MIDWVYIITLNILMFGGLIVVGKLIESVFQYIIDNFDELVVKLYK